MLPQPTLRTARLLLRPFTLTDAPGVQRMAGALEVASTTAAIPHPYEDGMAVEWIRGHAAGLVDETSVTYAITERDTGQLVGAIGMSVVREHSRAELGYWIGVPFWGQGMTQPEL